VEPLRRANLPTSIAEQLRQQILHGRLPAGERLPGHRELATMFGVSVGSVREALSMLQSEGLIETQAGRGTFVAQGNDVLPFMWMSSPMDRQKVAELIEAREVLESQLAAWAAERATPEQIDRLRSCVERMQSATNDASAFLEADIDLHLVIAEAAANRFLLRTMTGIRALLRRDLEISSEVAIRRLGTLEEVVAKHRNLVEAITARDPDGARVCIAAVIADNRKYVIGMYPESEPA
jgi:GntR family transcriptional regulator, transcriptional repressor for pyruvate dehydrogenase complex